MKNLFAMAMALGFAVGCGGGDDDRLVRDLSVTELKEQCEAANADAPTEPVTCTFMGTQITLEPEDFQSDCDAITMNNVPETCDVTVGEAQACDDALNEDPCAILTDIPPECEPVLTDECMTEDQGVRTVRQHVAAVRAHAQRI